MMDVKANKDLDLILIELKKSVSKKTLWLSLKGEMESFDLKVGYVFQMLTS